MPSHGSPNRQAARLGRSPLSVEPERPSSSLSASAFDRPPATVTAVSRSKEDGCVSTPTNARPMRTICSGNLGHRKRILPSYQRQWLAGCTTLLLLLAVEAAATVRCISNMLRSHTNPAAALVFLLLQNLLPMKSSYYSVRRLSRKDQHPSIVKSSGSSHMEENPFNQEQPRRQERVAKRLIQQRLRGIVISGGMNLGRPGSVPPTQHSLR